MENESSKSNSEERLTSDATAVPGEISRAENGRKNSNSDEQSPSFTLKLITYNIEGCSGVNLITRAEAVCKIIEAEQADIVFLQEVVEKTAEYIEERLPDYHCCFPWEYDENEEEEKDGKDDDDKTSENDGEDGKDDEGKTDENDGENEIDYEDKTGENDGKDEKDYEDKTEENDGEDEKDDEDKTGENDGEDGKDDGDKTDENDLEDEKDKENVEDEEGEGDDEDEIDVYFNATLLKKSSVSLVHGEVIDFPSTVRHLLKVNVIYKDLPLCLLNSHLSCCLSGSEKRKAQLRIVFTHILEAPENETVIFGGDVNLRDKELTELGDLPAGVEDVWVACGSQKRSEYTFDTFENDNLNVKWKARCRFDRVYIRRSSPSKLKPTLFKLIGLERIPFYRCFPSDHWGVLCQFEKDDFRFKLNTDLSPDNHEVQSLQPYWIRKTQMH